MFARFTRKFQVDICPLLTESTQWSSMKMIHLPLPFSRLNLLWILGYNNTYIPARFWFSFSQQHWLAPLPLVPSQHQWIMINVSWHHWLSRVFCPTVLQIPKTTNTDSKDIEAILNIVYPAGGHGEGNQSQHHCPTCRVHWAVSIWKVFILADTNIWIRSRSGPFDPSCLFHRHSVRSRLVWMCLISAYLWELLNPLLVRNLSTSAFKMFIDPVLQHFLGKRVPNISQPFERKIIFSLWWWQKWNPSVFVHQAKALDWLIFHDITEQVSLSHWASPWD